MLDARISTKDQGRANTTICLSSFSHYWQTLGKAYDWSQFWTITVDSRTHQEEKEHMPGTPFQGFMIGRYA